LSRSVRRKLTDPCQGAAAVAAAGGRVELET
jgi:hypothetical protein